MQPLSLYRYAGDPNVTYLIGIGGSTRLRPCHTTRHAGSHRAALRFQDACPFGLCGEISPLIEMDGEDDHVHLLVEYPPKVAVSNLVNSLKGVSSRLLRKDRPDIQKRY